MKPISRLASSTVLAVAVAACETHPRQTASEPSVSVVHSTPPPPPRPTPTPAPQALPTPTPNPNPNPNPNPTPAPTPTPAPASVSKVPYGIPIPGKSGFVQSPFAIDAGYVDVRGYAPNTEVKDPYSGKIFLVP